MKFSILYQKLIKKIDIWMNCPIFLKIFPNDHELRTSDQTIYDDNDISIYCRLSNFFINFPTSQTQSSKFKNFDDIIIIINS